MCNRYRMTARHIDLARAMNITLPLDEFPNLPVPDLFPRKPARVIRRQNDQRTVDTMTWGFPHLVKTPKTGKLVEKAITNVRNLASPFWRNALTNPARRCLVPVTEFSEYGPGVPGKLPLHWFSVPSRPVFAFAGVWRPIADGAAFAFLTCEPNPLIAAIHPKAMPVILDVEDYDRWLTCDYAGAVLLALPYPSQLMASCGASATAGAPELEVEEVPVTGVLDVDAD